MGINKNVRFDKSMLSNEKADGLYWEIKNIDHQISTFTKDKREQQDVYRKRLEKIQDECGKSTEDHDFRLYEEAAIEIDRDIYKCQKCGKQNTSNY